jgi:hypothetical protein
VTPSPTNPTPVNPTPTNPTPVNPTPTNPTPVNPTPVNPTPIGSTPQPIPPVTGVPVGPGRAFSIELVVVDGSGQDAFHAKYKPGSKLTLGARIRDAMGNIINAGSGCTPMFRVADNISADGGVKGMLANNTITFGNATGAFSVSAFCQEDPRITSERNQNPFNFETSNDTFAKCKGCSKQQTGGEPDNKPKPRARNAALGALLAGVLVAGVVLAVVAAQNIEPGGGTSGANCGQVNCPSTSSCCENAGAGGSDICCPSGFPVYCPATNRCLTGPQGSGPCDVVQTTVCGRPARTVPADGTYGARSVEHLVALGMNPPATANAPGGAATKRRAIQRSGPPRWLAPAVVGAGLITTAVTAYLQMRVDEGARFDVWVTSDAAGLGIEGRF